MRVAASEFRAAREGWATLYETLFSANYAPLHQASQLIDERERLFREQGNASVAARRAIEGELGALRTAADETLAFSEAEERDWREGIREAVLALQALETKAFDSLQEVMA